MMNLAKEIVQSNILHHLIF